METMTNEELRIKIAKIQGWKTEPFHEVDDSPTSRLLDKTGRMISWDFGEDLTIEDFTVHIPDYPNSISAAMELEDALPVDRRWEYVFTLMKLIRADWKFGDFLDTVNMWSLVRATAEQRCRAWVETMEASCLA